MIFGSEAIRRERDEVLRRVQVLLDRFSALGLTITEYDELEEKGKRLNDLDRKLYPLRIPLLTFLSEQTTFPEVAKLATTDLVALKQRLGMPAMDRKSCVYCRLHIGQFPVYFGRERMWRLVCSRCSRVIVHRNASALA